MNGPEDHKPDTRQLEKWRNWGRSEPGHPRLFHLSGPAESYVLSSWHLSVGDPVRASEVIATIETDSLRLDFEAVESGVLAKQCFAVGDIIPNGAVIARIVLFNSEHSIATPTTPGSAP